MTIQTDPQYKLRMPPELRDKLKAAAKANHRSMNAEMVARLQESFDLTARPNPKPTLDSIPEEEKALFEGRYVAYLDARLEEERRKDRNQLIEELKSAIQSALNNKR